MQCTFDPSKIIINQKILNLNVNECFNIDTQANINMENKKSQSSVQLKENERIMNSESNQSQINYQTSFIDFKAMDGLFKKMYSVSKLQANIPIINKLSRTDSFKCLSDQIRMNQYMSLYQQSNPAHSKDLAMKTIPQLSLLKQKIKKRPVFQSIKFNVLNQNQVNKINVEPKNCLDNKIIIPISIPKENKSNNHSPLTPLTSPKQNNSKMNELNEEYLLDLGIPTRTSSKIEGNPNRISRKVSSLFKYITTSPIVLEED